MTLRRLERLLTEARYSSNTEDITAISDTLLVLYSNRTQSMIEDRLFMANSMNNIFMDELEITIDSDEREYALPHDIYAVNAIKSVSTKDSDGNVLARLDFIPESQVGLKWGYSLKENNILLDKKLTDQVFVNYVRKIPTLGKRFGLVSAIGAGTVTVPATASTELLDNYDDFFSLVDSNGVVVVRNLKVVSYVYTTGVITYSGGTGTVATGLYVIPGKYSTSHSQLPLEAEKIFLEVLERRIAQRQSQADTTTIIAPLTEQECQLVDAVFAKGSEDNEIPPIGEWGEWF